MRRLLPRPQRDVQVRQVLIKMAGDPDDAPASTLTESAGRSMRGRRRYANRRSRQLMEGRATAAPRRSADASGYGRQMASWTIRPAATVDIDAVLGLWGSSDAMPSSTDNPSALTRLINEFNGLLLAERAGVLIGTLIATWDGWRGNMYRLVVDQRVRRQGLALALVAAGEERLTRLGCRRFSALVTDTHDHAVSFWTAAGYSADPTMTRYVKMP